MSKRNLLENVLALAGLIAIILIVAYLAFSIYDYYRPNEAFNVVCGDTRYNNVHIRLDRNESLVVVDESGMMYYHPYISCHWWETE